jgi:integrase
MPRDPFCDHKLRKVKKDRGYLTRAELERIIDFKPDSRRLEKVRDIFLFCCFTGYDYSTTASLTDKNIVIHDDGAQWIETHRVKTGTVAKVKLLDIPLSIIEKYRLRRDGNFLLPVMSNAKYNQYLKELAAPVWNREARDLTPCPAHICDDYYALQRCAARNGQ